VEVLGVGVAGDGGVDFLLAVATGLPEGGEQIGGVESKLSWPV
jgi:hypothetical protein